jgi:hypothetical protein
MLRHVRQHLGRLVAEGRGDMPLRSLRFRCTHRRSRLTDSVVLPWQPPLPGEA